jgi:hypothetical protein
MVHQYLGARDRIGVAYRPGGHQIDINDYNAVLDFADKYVRTVNSWSGGYQGEVTVRAGTAAVNGWTVRWTLPGGSTISQLWSGTLSVSGSAVTVRNASYNGSLAANASTTFGLLGTGTPSTPALTCTIP